MSCLRQSLEDFFDVRTFPGKRGLPHHPRYVLEMALMADGVTPDQVYTELATEDGRKRAFAKLDTIRKHVVWLRSAKASVAALKDKNVSMTVGGNSPESINQNVAVNALVAIVPGAGHVWSLGSPDTLVSTLLDFYDSL